MADTSRCSLCDRHVEKRLVCDVVMYICGHCDRRRCGCGMPEVTGRQGAECRWCHKPVTLEAHR